jgi:uncharacterized SAM-binding protein YcdF (DUF218 family)
MILGKELRHHPDRARAELAARSAGAAVALRRGAQCVVNLEAPLKGQGEAGSQIVRRYLTELGVEPAQMLLAERTRSTREEALEGAALCRQKGWSRLLVVTARYHVERARQHFEEQLGSRVLVTCPEALWQGARPLERQWMERGIPDLEVRAGAWLRGVDEASLR